MLCTRRASEVRGSILDWWHAPQPAAVAPGEVNPARLTENYSRDLEQPWLPTGLSVLARVNQCTCAHTHTYPLHKCVIPTASCLVVYKQTTEGKNNLPHHKPTWTSVILRDSLALLSGDPNYIKKDTHTLIFCLNFFCIFVFNVLVNWLDERHFRRIMMTGFLIETGLQLLWDISLYLRV